MRHNYPSWFGVQLVAVLVVGIAATAGDNTRRVLYTKELGSGRKLVVVAGPPVPAKELPPEIAAAATNPASSMSSISVELNLPNLPTCLLWSGFGNTHDYKILDTIMTKGRVIVALVTESERVELWSVGIGVGGNLEIDRPAQVYWKALAAGPLGDLSCRLEYDESGDRVTAEITNHVENGKQHALFGQQGRKWKFDCLKHWSD